MSITQQILLMYPAGGPPPLSAFNINKVAWAMDGETLTDISPYEWYINSTGNVQPTTTQVKFGTHSLTNTNFSPLTTLYPNPILSMQSPGTVAFWLYPLTPLTTAKVIGNRDDAVTGNGWEVSMDNTGAIFFQAGSSAVTTSAGVVAVNSWYHVLVTYLSGTVYIFVNGALKASGAISWSNPTTTTGNLDVLSRTASPHLPVNGFVDDLIVSNEVLTTVAFTPPVASSIPSFPGGFSTWNIADKGASVTLSTGARRAWSINSANSVRGTQSRATGSGVDRYFEVNFNGGTGVAGSSPDNIALIGVGKSTASLTSFPGVDANGWAYYPFAQQWYNNGVGTAYTGGTNTNVIGVWLKSNGNLLFKTTTSDPTTVAATLTGTFFPMWGQGSTSGVRECWLNTGAIPFALGLPAGATAWG